MRSEGLRENEGKLVSGETAAKDSQDNDKKERFYEYLVMAGRRGGWRIKLPFVTLLQRKKGRGFSKI